MRFLLACLAFVFALSIAAPTSAQGFPPGPWRGVWTNSGQYEYQAELDFTMELSGRVVGQIRWMLVRSPRHEEQVKIGLRGVEYVEGAFDRSRRKAFERHLKRCADCDMYLRQMRQTIEITGRLAASDVEEVPEAVRLQLLAAFRASAPIPPARLMPEV